MAQESGKTIGSFFESPNRELIGAEKRPPWEAGIPVSYVQTGRQALAYVGKVYAEERRNKLIVPEYLCQSMLVGFDPQHWEISTYRITPELTIDTEDLVEKVYDPRRTVVLSATYFGNEPHARHITTLRALQSEGTKVIEDETHRIFGSLDPLGDVGIASLRKTLPVADGAYIRGSLQCEPRGIATSSGWSAMDEKATGNIEKARALYTESNLEMSAQIFTKFAPTSRTMQVIRTLDYEILKERRRKNAETLRSNLLDASGIEVIINAAVPSHLVIRIPDAETQQKRLAAKGIFCPIHWPQPEQFSGIEWRNDLLSIPIDHRYNQYDMRRISLEVKSLKF